MLASNILTMMLLPKLLQTFPHSMQQPGQWAAHLTRGVDILVACYTCTEALAEIYQIRIENQQKRKEGHNPDRRKGKKGGGREGRKEGKGREGKGRKEGREDGRKKETKAELQNVVCTFPFTHVTFKELQVPSNLQTLVSKCGKDRAVY